MTRGGRGAARQALLAVSAPCRAVRKDGDTVIALTMGNAIMPEKRLLVCDDEAAVGRLVQNAAAALGYDVRITTSGEEWMRTYDDFQPTIILLDMVMPGVDGNKVIMWLASRGCTARLIIMIGYHPDYAGHAEILARYKGLGPVMSLDKPFGVREVASALGAA